MSNHKSSCDLTLSLKYNPIQLLEDSVKALSGKAVRHMIRALCEWQIQGDRKWDTRNSHSSDLFGRLLDGTGFCGGGRNEHDLNAQDTRFRKRLLEFYHDINREQAQGSYEAVTEI